MIMINLQQSSLSELEKEQDRLHELFETLKGECYDKYVEMLKASDSYKRIEEEIKKRKGYDR